LVVDRRQALSNKDFAAKRLGPMRVVVVGSARRCLIANMNDPAKENNLETSQMQL
jgi:hypothetical protein